MLHVAFTGHSHATVYRRSIVDMILGRAGEDRRVYLGSGGRWYYDCSGRHVGARVQFAIERAHKRARLLARATAPPS